MSDGVQIPDKRCCHHCLKKGRRKWAVKNGLCTRCQRDINKPIRKTKKSSRGVCPVYSEQVLAEAISALVNMSHKKGLATKAVEAVCLSPGKSLPVIITDAIKHLANKNGHPSHQPVAPSPAVKCALNGKHRKTKKKSKRHKQPQVVDNDKMVIKVDFSTYPHLLQVLKDFSKREYRTPDEQVIAMIADWHDFERIVSAKGDNNVDEGHKYEVRSRE